MRRYGKKKETVERDVLEEVRCDLCGALAKHNKWSQGFYEVNETDISVTVKQREGSSYPEGSMGTEYDIDLCPKCFKERLVPWLVSQGANIEQKDWVY
jgi:uncharacterized protein (DUF2225 family)